MECLSITFAPERKYEDNVVMAAPLLHALALMYSSCAEHPIQRLFLAIAVSQIHKLYGGDAKDAFAIDEQYSDWYQRTFHSVEYHLLSYSGNHLAR